MFDWVKNLFKKKDVKVKPAVPVNPVVKSKPTPAFRAIQQQKKSRASNSHFNESNDDFLTGMVVGDIANDGCLCSCSESSGSSYSDPCSSYDSGSSCDSGSCGCD